MAAKKKKHSTPRELVERRFLPGRAQTSVAAFVVGALGAAALGAGVWGRFFADPMFEHALYLLVPGAALLAGAVVWGGDVAPVRVGDAGVAMEANAELVRVPWCDVERIRIVGAHLVVSGGQLSLSIPLAAHAQAAAWVLAEAARRRPQVVDVKSSAADALPKPLESAGESRKIDDLQVAGKQCRRSGQLIAFEGDARLCANCGAVYHRAHVPERCEACEAKLGDRALPVPASS